MVQFSIILVSYNSERDIRECLGSIRDQDFSDYEVIQVDNASSDGTIRIAKEFGERVRLKVNDKNKGFPEALNDGIALSRGRYILTLNPDVVLNRDFLSILDKAIQGFESSVGMVGVKLLRKAGSDRIIDSTGLVLSRMIRFFDRGSGEIDRGQYDEAKDILGPCAAAAVYKRAMLEEIKLDGEYFDKDFFYLIEDFDVALRARKKGWSCRYVPEAVCYHTRNGVGVSRSYRQYLTFRNRYFLIAKNVKMAPVLILSFFVYDIPRLIFMLFSNKQTLSALREIREHLPGMLKKRGKIMATASVGSMF